MFFYAVAHFFVKGCNASFKNTETGEIYQKTGFEFSDRNM